METDFIGGKIDTYSEFFVTCMAERQQSIQAQKKVLKPKESKEPDHLAWLKNSAKGKSFYYQDDSRKWIQVKFQHFNPKGKNGPEIGFVCRESPFIAPATDHRRYSPKSPDARTDKVTEVKLKKCHRKWPVLIQTKLWDQPMVAIYVKTDKKILQSKFECVAPYSSEGLLKITSDNEQSLQEAFWLHHAEIKQVQLFEPDALENDDHELVSLYKELISPHLAFTCFTYDRVKNSKSITGSTRLVLHHFFSQFSLRQMVQIMTNAECLQVAVEELQNDFQRCYPETPISDKLFMEPGLLDAFEVPDESHTAGSSDRGTDRKTGRNQRVPPSNSKEHALPPRQRVKRKELDEEVVEPRREMRRPSGTPPNPFPAKSSPKPMPKQKAPSKKNQLGRVCDL